MSEQIDQYIEFVNEQIEKFQSNTSLIRDEQITPESMNRALAEYGTVSGMLISEYQRAKLEHYRIESEFTDWWDQKVNESRKRILSGIEGKKYPAYKEYELDAKDSNGEEYRAYQDKLRVAEEKVSFYKNLLDIWKKQDQILVNLSLNMRSEMKSLSLENRMNANPKKRKARRTVKTETEDAE